MPDAHTHDIITVATGAVLTLPVYAYTLHQTDNSQVALANTAIFFVAHCVSGMLFSPDLDLDSSIDNRWGVFFWIWRPYMWVVPHRSRMLSHGLIFPALLRLAYFYLVVMGLMIGLTWALGRLGIIWPDYHIQLTNYIRAVVGEHPREVVSFLVAFCTGGAVHTIADWLVTGGKHYLYRMGFRISKRYENHDQWQPRRRRHRVRVW